MKKFYQFLVLIFIIFVSSTFDIPPDLIKCKRGGTCGKYKRPGVYIAQELPDWDITCYYYKCRIGQRMFMEGSGNYDDFVNTCKYVDPKIRYEAYLLVLKHIPYVGHSYVYNDQNLILAVCDNDKQEKCQKIFSDKDTYKNIHEQFGNTYAVLTAYDQKDPDTCTYNNTPLAKLPQVQCETGGVCQAGKEFSLWKIKEAKIVNKTCDACVMFVCTVDGKKIIEGSGCYEDFVKACNNTNPNAVARFKEKTIDKEEGIKSNFYYDNSMIVASCSDADNCHKYAFDSYLTDKVVRAFYVEKYFANEKCSYEKIIEASNATASPEACQHSNGITSIKLFFGIYLLLALIY